MNEYKVLIADDSQTIRKIIRLNLEKFGIKTVLEAADGENALRVLGANSDINLLFLDFTMPGINGLEVMRKVRDMKAFTTLRTIVVSSSVDDRLTQAFAPYSVTGFIAKPFDLQKFNAILRPILDDTSTPKAPMSEKGIPKEDVIRLFNGETPKILFSGKHIEFDFQSEKIKLDVDTISRYGSLFSDLKE